MTIGYVRPKIDTRRGHSPDLWRGCLREQMKYERDLGSFYSWEGDNGDLVDNGWTLTTVTTGTEATAKTDEHGTTDIDSGAATDGQGCNLQNTDFGVIPAAGTNIWFEMRVANSLVGGDLFFGLANDDTTVIASSLITTTSHVGFSSVTANGILISTSEKAGVTATGSTLHTFVADAYVKIGFKITGVTKIEWYVNGDIVDAATDDFATAQIPAVVIFPTIVNQGDGTNQAVLTVDWIDVANQKILTH